MRLPTVYGVFALQTALVLLSVSISFSHKKNYIANKDYINWVFLLLRGICL